MKTNRIKKFTYLMYLWLLFFISITLNSICQNTYNKDTFTIQKRNSIGALVNMDYDIELDGVYYKVISMEQHTVRAVGLVDDSVTDILIPKHFPFLQVTFKVIEVNMEENYDNLEQISFPDTLELLHFERCGITSLAANATVITGFNNCPNLESVFLIGDVNGFNNCPSMKSVFLKGNVNGFNSCSSLEVVNLDGNIDGFKECGNLKHLTISANTTFISSISFHNCHIEKMDLIDGDEILLLQNSNDQTNYIVDTLYCGRNLDINSYDIKGLVNVTFGQNVTVYFASMLEHLSKWIISNEGFILVHGGFELENCKIEEFDFNVKSIFFDSYSFDGLPHNGNIDYDVEPYYHVFTHNYQDCTYSNWILFPLLKRIYYNSYSICMPNSCNKDLQLAFGCNTIEIYGNDATIIGDSAFIKMESCVPPQLVTDFSIQTYLYTTLYVPQGTLEEYQEADKWKHFVNIKEYDFECVSYTIKLINSYPKLYGITASIEGYGPMYPYAGYLHEACCTEAPSENNNYNDTIIMECNPNQAIRLFSGPIIYSQYNTLPCHDAVEWKENDIPICQSGPYAFHVTKDRTLTLCYNETAFRKITLIIDTPNDNEFVYVGHSFYEYLTDSELFEYHQYNDRVNSILLYKGIPSYTTRIRMKGDNVRYWSGDVSQNGNTVDFVLNRDYTITAHCSLGINEDIANNLFAFVEEDRTITIAGSEDMSSVIVYNLQGQRIYEGLSKTIKVPRSGMYFVVVENQAIKVIVQ